MDEIRYTYYDSPIGRLLLAADQRGLRLIHFETENRPKSPAADWIEEREALTSAIAQLQAYFRGELKEFRLPLSLVGTDFQLRVWRSLCSIPYGQTTTYGELARRLGVPQAARAVGLANGSNPIPIIVPCHRVIGSNGKLVGYGGGLPIKKKLLALEQNQRALGFEIAG